MTRAAVSRPPERGSATAETAVALSGLLLVLAAAAFALACAVAQLRCVDAARAGARALARGEPPALARAATLADAPRRAQVLMTAGEDGVQVRVVAVVVVRAGVLSRLPGVRVSATATASREQP